MTKKKDGATTIYNVLGDNARWNVNSPDNSVNIVLNQVMNSLPTCESELRRSASSEEQKMILQKLDALKEATESRPLRRHTQISLRPQPITSYCLHPLFPL